MLICASLLLSSEAMSQMVVYSEDDYQLHAMLCKPEGDGPFPAVIYHHGGLGKIIGGVPSETCAELKASGFVGFSPIRRSTKPLSGHLDDVAAALSYLKNLDYVDPGRIGVMGFSRGGLLTYQEIARQEIYQAAVIMAPAVGRDGKALKGKLSAGIDIPVLLLVAQNDTGSRTTMGKNTLKAAKKLRKAFKKRNKDVEMIIYPSYPGDGHKLFFEIGDYFMDVIRFFKQNL